MLASKTLPATPCGLTAATRDVGKQRSLVGCGVSAIREGDES